MRVRMKSTISGTRDGLSWPPVGAFIDLPDDEAKAMIANGQAVEVVDEPAPVETRPAPTDDVETATPRRGPGRPRKNP